MAQRPNPAHRLLVQEFYWRPAMSTCLCFIHGHFGAAMTAVKSCDRDLQPRKPKPLSLWSLPETVHSPCIPGGKGKQALSRRPWELPTVSGQLQL